MLTGDRYAVVIFGRDFKTILCGDSPSTNKDLVAGNSITNPRNREKNITKMNDLGLWDPFSINNPNEKEFTWRSWDGSGQRSRLDFFLTSKYLTKEVNYVQTSETPLLK